MTTAWREAFVFSPPGFAGRLGRILYRAGYLLFRVLFRVLWRARIDGTSHVPLRGPVILASNHASFFDPPLVGSSVDRPIYFMAKEELFRVPLFGTVIRLVNAFPVRRGGGDVGAFRTATRILKGGGAMILFPEGRRQAGGRLGEPRPGVGLLAAHTGAHVVPIYCRNTHRARFLAALSVTFGGPLALGAEESPEAFSRRVMDAIRRLREEAPHGSDR